MKLMISGGRHTEALCLLRSFLSHDLWSCNLCVTLGVLVPGVMRIWSRAESKVKLFTLLETQKTATDLVTSR